jgi:tetratricopeptide (TPR) repeat protein
MATNAFQMGTVHFNDGNYLDALKSLSRAVELAPEEAEFHNALALAYGARGLYDKAIEYFSKAISLDPMLSEAYVNLGALYLNKKEWDKAVDISRGALKNVFYKTPEFAYNNIAWGLLNKGDYAGAIANLLKAVELNPKYKWGYNNLGLALERAGRDDDALRAYQSAINIDQDFAAAYLNMGIVLQRNNDKAAAMNAFNKAVEAAPESPWAARARLHIDELRSKP